LNRNERGFVPDKEQGLVIATVRFTYFSLIGKFELMKSKTAKWGLAPLALAAMAVLALASPASAATITWGTATNIATDSDVITTGTYVDSVKLFNALGTVVVNGVTFAAPNGFSDFPTHPYNHFVSQIGDITAQYDGTFGTVTSFSGGSAQYSGLGQWTL
jgi:hypothetical protein